MLRRLTAALVAVALACLPLRAVGISQEKPSAAKREDSKTGDSKEKDPTKVSDSPDAILKDMIKLMNDLADAIGSARARESAQKAKATLEKIDKKFRDVAKRAKKLKDPPKEQQKALEKKYKGDLEKVTKRMVEASSKMVANPEAAKI